MTEERNATDGGSTDEGGNRADGREEGADEGGSLTNENERYLRELYETTSSTGLTFEEKVRRLLALGCDRLGLRYGFLIRVMDDEFEVVEMRGTHDQFRRGLVAPLPKTYCKHVLDAEEGTFGLRDAVAEGYADDPAHESGLVCYLGSQVTVRDEPYGTFCFADTEPREAAFTAAEETFVELMGEWVSYGLERRQYEAELERSNAELEQFAYGASHDLREPLRMVTSYLQLLERRYGDELDADAREFIGFAVDGAERMKGMIDALLAYSRLTTEGREFRPVDCEAVLADTLKDIEVRIAERDAEITAEPLPTVRGDPNQLPQLFQNLLVNAITYSEDAPRVHVSAEADGDEWVLSVADEGIGIPADRQDDVFEAFNRLHGTGEYSGSGIGLAACRKIVENHGGRIWVDSEPGAGSTFSFTLPDADADEE